MSDVALSGSDTVILNNRVIRGLADGDCVKITFPNEIAQVKTGKNGNSIYALNESGKQAEVELRIVKGCADDKFLNGLLAAQQANFAGTVLLTGEFIKQLGDGAGNILADTYIVSGGIFNKQVDAKTSVEGDVDQSVSVYKMKFSNAPRVMT